MLSQYNINCNFCVFTLVELCVNTIRDQQIDTVGTTFDLAKHIHQKNIIFSYNVTYVIRALKHFFAWNIIKNK